MQASTAEKRKLGCLLAAGVKQPFLTTALRLAAAETIIHKDKEAKRTIGLSIIILYGTTPLVPPLLTRAALPYTARHQTSGNCSQCGLWYSISDFRLLLTNMTTLSTPFRQPTATAAQVPEGEIVDAR